MSDEEKKAIEIVKGITEDDLLNYWEGPEEPYNAIQTLLNLIKKQSKEIEELKEENRKKSIVIIEYQDLYEKLEDKIKAKIEEYKKQQKEEPDAYLCIKVLSSLLEKE